MSANDAKERIGELASVREIRTEHWLSVASSKSFKHNEKKLDNFTNTVELISDSEMAVNYFDENNNIIENMDKGYFYGSVPFLQNIDIKEGDELELDINDSHLTLRFMGQFKGALFSSENNASPYCIINSADYDYLYKDEASHIINYK